jgi:DNA-binding response OmpR family regulator
MSTMLVIDDDPAWRSLYLLEFGKQFDIFEANDGIQALSMLDSVKPDVILLDLRLPRMDGRTFLRQMERRGVKARVVVCSGMLPESDASTAGLILASKSADLREVRTAVRAAVASPGSPHQTATALDLSDEPEWLD